MSEPRDQDGTADHDLVDEAGEESFPASDPPAWSPPGGESQPDD